MKVLYVITRAERGGGQVHVADLLSGFRDKHTLELAIGEDGYLCEKARRLGVPVHILASLRQPIAPLHDALALGTLINIVKRTRPDVIHAHTSKAGLVARLAAALTGTPVVFTAHTWSFTEGTSRLRRSVCMPIEHLCAPLSTTIITVSEANRRSAVNAGMARSAQMKTIWNGVPDTPLRSNPGDDNKIVRIVMVARFAEQKDQCLLIRALAAISRSFEMIFVGSGPLLDSAQQLASHLGLGEKIQFWGDRDDVPEILSAAHIFVLSSKWEGLPLSILEAMRAGLPIVASNVGGVGEAIIHEESGLLAPAGDEVALRGALERLLSDSRLRAFIGRKARRRYEENFLLRAMLSKTERVYYDATGISIEEALCA